LRLLLRLLWKSLGRNLHVQSLIFTLKLLASSSKLLVRVRCHSNLRIIIIIIDFIYLTNLISLKFVASLDQMIARRTDLSFKILALKILLLSLKRLLLSISNLSIHKVIMHLYCLKLMDQVLNLLILYILKQLSFLLLNLFFLSQLSFKSSHSLVLLLLILLLNILQLFDFKLLESLYLVSPLGVMCVECSHEL
jgi:hypothetical protein